MQNDSIYGKMSNSEKMVADFLQDLNLWWVYEQPVIVKDEGDRLRNWYPDFYLSEMGIYIEVCGADRKSDYEYRKRIYKDNRINVIFLYTYKGRKIWIPYLIKSILEIEVKRGELLKTRFPEVMEREKNKYFNKK